MEVRRVLFRSNSSIQLLDAQSTESAEAFTVQINGAQLAVSGTQLQIFDASGTGTIAASDKVLLYDTTAFGCPDPAGLTYDPSSGRLLLVDSEVAERSEERRVGKEGVSRGRSRWTASK